MNNLGVAAVVIIALLLLAGQFEPALLGERDMSFATISKGFYGGFNEAKNIVRPEGEAIFVELHMGEFSTAGYGIEVKGIKEFPDRIIVKVERTFPGSCIVTQALTQPFHIIKIPKTSKPLIFEYADMTVEC